MLHNIFSSLHCFWEETLLLQKLYFPSFDMIRPAKHKYEFIFTAGDPKNSGKIRFCGVVMCTQETISKCRYNLFECKRCSFCNYQKGCRGFDIVLNRFRERLKIHSIFGRMENSNQTRRKIFESHRHHTHHIHRKSYHSKPFNTVSISKSQRTRLRTRFDKQSETICPQRGNRSKRINHKSFNYSTT